MGGLHKQNLLLPDDPYGLAPGYGKDESLVIRQYLLGMPWTRLVNEGYIVDPAGNGFYSISDEGEETLKGAGSPDVKTHSVDDRQATTISPPRVFVSYSWESPEHKEWVLRLAERLRGESGVEVVLDRWHLVPGGDKTVFMEKSITASDFVILVCTPTYATRANNREGGVGYEAMIVTGQLAERTQQEKFIPVLRNGSWQSSLPGWIKSRIGVDLRDDPYSDDSYLDLLRALHKVPLQPPPIGPKPNLSGRSPRGTPREGSRREVEALEKQKTTRRKFGWEFFATAALVTVGLIQTGEMTPDFLDKIEERNRRRKQAVAKEGELHELLTCYLYPSNPGSGLEARVPLVPAMQDPWGPPKRQFSGSGNEVAAAYYSAFRSWKDKQIVQPNIDVNDDDAPVLIASHLVSEPAARYFGDPKSPRPIHEVLYDDSGGGFRAGLRWAIYTPEDAREVSKRELFQGTPMIRKEPVHKLSDLDDPKLPQPVFIRQGDIDYQQDDYLLITVLPRDSRLDRRMVSLAGLHKPGTLAAGQFLEDDSDLALKILRAIDEKIQGLPYYQALIAAKVDHKKGSPRPTHLELRGVHVINAVARRRS